MVNSDYSKLNARIFDYKLAIEKAAVAKTDGTRSGGNPQGKLTEISH
jgi:hypothetical protein